MILRRSLTAFCAVIVIIISMPLYCFGSESEAVTYQGVNTYAPFEYVQDGNLQGFGPELSRLIFADGRYHVEYSADTLERAFQRVVQGKIDSCGLRAVIPERQGQVLFSTPVLETYTAFYIRKGTPFSLTKLNQIKLGVQHMDYTSNLLKREFKVGNFVLYDSQEQALSALKRGEIDAFFGNQEATNYYIIKNQLGGTIIPEKSNLLKVQFAFVVSKRNTELLNYMNSRIATLQKAGIYEQVYRKYFFRSSPYQDEVTRTRLVWGGAIVFALGAFVFVLLQIYIGLLRRRLDKSNHDLSARNKLLSVTLGSIGEAVVSTDIHRKITYMNHTAENLSGVDISDALGKQISVLGTFYNKNEIVDIYDASSTEELAEMLDGDFSFITPDEDQYFVICSASVLKETSGQVIGMVIILRNVTERKAVEAALRESEETHRQIFENSPLGILYFDRTGRITVCNDIFVGIIGSSRTALIGLNMLDLPDKGIRHAVSLALTGRAGNYEGIYKSVTADKLTPVRGIFAPIKSTDGTVLAGVGIIEDITESKKALDRLSESEEKYRAIFEHAPIGILHFDKTGSITAINDKLLEIVGGEESQLMQINLFELKDSIMTPAIERALKGIESILEGNYHSPFIEKVTVVRAFVAPIFSEDHGVVGGTCIIEDITDRRQATLKLRESEEKYRAIFENSGSAMIIIDDDTTILLANGEFERISGYRRDEMEGKIKWIEFVSKNDLERMQNYHKLRRRGEYLAPQKYEFVFVDRFGIMRDSMVEVGLIEGTSQTVAAVTDMTERKYAERQVMRLNLELEERVRERTAQLEAANRELEAFSYSVSHDLRAPLRSIDGFSQVLLEEYSDKVDEVGVDYVRRVRSASQRMAQLIDDLLKLSRITRADMYTEDVNLSKMGWNIINELKNSQPERAVEFVIESNMFVSGDSHLLRVALENLLENAWKYTSKQSHARIEFGYKEEDGHRVFFIKDNGVGFDPTYTDKLFGAFQRLHTREEFPGTGIGLATVQRVINRHGGMVWAEGQIGVGATFYFTLQEAKEDQDE